MIKNGNGGKDKMKMKKISAVFVLMLFTISMIPLAAAEDGTIDSEDSYDLMDVETVDAVAIESEEATELTEEVEVVSDDEEVVEELEEIAEESPEIIEAVEELPDTISETICYERVKARYPNAAEWKIRKVCKWRRHLRKSTHRFLTKPTPRIDRKVKAIKHDRLVEADKPRPVVRRQIAKERIENSRREFVQAKNRYLELRKHYKDARPKFIAAKKAYRECKGVESEECDQKRKQLKQHGKEFLLNAADRVLESLNKLVSKIESSEDMDEERAADILADLKDKITEIEDARSVIEALDEDSTTDEIKEAADTIRKAWAKTKHHMKKAVGHLTGAKIRQILFHSEKLYEKFTKMSDRLEENGKDVSELDALLEEYRSNLDNANEAYENAADKWKEIKNVEDADDLLKEAHEYMIKARDYLKETRQTLREIVKEIRSQGKDVSSDEEADDVDEAEEADEDESDKIDDEDEITEEDESEEISDEEADDETEDEEDESEDDGSEEDDESEDESGQGDQNQTGQA